MKDSSRKLLDKSFTALATFTLVMLGVCVAAFLLPIIIRGAGAVVFKATVEHEKVLCENFGRDASEADEARFASTNAAREKFYALTDAYESAAAAEKFASDIDALRSASTAGAAKYKERICGALKLKSSERAAKIREISQKLWSGYADTLARCVKESETSGGSYGLEKFLDAEADKLSAAGKEISKTLTEGSGAGYSARSAVARNSVHYALGKLEEAKSDLAETNAAYNVFKSGVRELLGPRDALEKNSLNLMRQKYGQTRYENAKKIFSEDIETLTLTQKDASGAEKSVRVSAREKFSGTPVEKMLDTLRADFDAMLAPHTAFYWGFFTDNPADANIFGGIFPMIVGTFWLTLGAMLVAAPLGMASAVYFSEYARGGGITGFLRMCVGTLAGVPSVVFGLFGLAFLINTLKVSDGKSVLAGSLTLALLILPTIIRSCEEALKAVPNSYREAAGALGATKAGAILTVVLPAALPSMLTGIIISMGRAAGETAPIIFTAATSTGLALGLGELFSQPTTALPWNIYNICSEHEMAERVGHVQYGMALTLTAIVLGLNLAAIILRMKLQRKLKNR